MSDRRKLKPERPGREPDFLVCVQAAITVRIWGTKDPDEAEERAINRVRGLFDGIDSELYIPRALVVPGNMTPKQLEEQLKTQIKPKESQ